MVNWNYKGKAIALMLMGVLSACGGDSEQTAESTLDNTQEVLDFYAANPDMFTFATPADIPDDLVWEDGMDLPEIGSPEATKGGTYYDYLEDFPPTIRPIGPDSNSSARNWVSDYFGMAYATPHPDVEGMVPGIAKSWAVSPERKTVYVKMNPEARWDEEHYITSDDAMFAFFFYLSDYIQAPYSTNYFKNEYANITKYDDHTFSVTVTRVKPDMDALVLWTVPKPQFFYKELGPDYPERYQWRSEPNAGPYTLADADINMGVRLLLRRDESWWAKDNKYFRYRFNPDVINLTVIRDTAKRMEAFRRGDLDMFELKTAEQWYEDLGDSSPEVVGGYIQKAVFYHQYPLGSWGLWMNSSRPLLDNQEVRLGIQYASNWDLILSNYFRGDLDRLKSQNEGFGEFSDTGLSPRKFDLEEAQRHFANAGFVNRGPDGVLVNSEGARLSLTLSSHYERYSDIFTILREEALKAGLELRIEMLDGAAGFKKALEKQHDIYFVGFVAAPSMYPELSQNFHSKYAYDKAFLDDGSANPDRKIVAQGNNLEAIAIYDLDQLIDEYIASEDGDQMVELAHQIQKMVYDYAAWIPGFAEPYYREGYWRWIKWPEGFNGRITERAQDLFAFWIDAEEKEETLAARRSGQTFEPVIQVFDQFREQ
jgi:microcin C transport system substrate-binding protein